MRLHSASFCAAITLLSGLTLAAAPVSRHRAQSAAPDRLFAENKFDQARTAYMAALKNSPGQVSLRLGLIRTLLRLDSWEEAISQGRRAIAQAPQNADAHGLLSLALMRGGQPEEAAKEADRALALDKNSYWALVASGRTSVWDDQNEGAHSLLSHATQIHPDWPDAWCYLQGTHSHDKAGFEEAIKDFQTYIKLAPKGHPHDWNLDGAQGALAYTDKLAKDKAHRPFQAMKPYTEEQLKAADEGKSAPIGFTIPVKCEEDGTVIVPVQVNGVETHLLLDTGAGSDISLGKMAAARAHLTELSRSFARGVNGKEVSILNRAETFQIGPQSFGAVPISSVETEIGDYEGLIGGAVFDEYAVTIDYEEKTLTLRRGKNAVAPPAEQGHSLVQIPFHLIDGYIIVPTRIDNRDVWCMLDSGAGGFGVLSLRLARVLAAERPQISTLEVPIKGRFGIGISDTTITALLFGYSVDVGLRVGNRTPHFIQMKPIYGASMMDSQVSRAFDFQLGALVGISYLSDAKRVTIDYPHHLLTLEMED